MSSRRRLGLSSLRVRTALVFKRLPASLDAQKRLPSRATDGPHRRRAVLWLPALVKVLVLVALAQRATQRNRKSSKADSRNATE